MSTNLPEKIDLADWSIKELAKRYNQLLDYLAEREKSADDQRTTKL